MKKSEREIIRELAKEYSEISNLPVQKEKEKLFTAINDLDQIRPAVLMDELPWHELNAAGELNLFCEDPFCKRYEEFMRKTLYKWRHMRADMIVPNYMWVRKHADVGSNGIVISERTISKNDGNNIVSHEFYDTLKTDEDIERLHVPEIIPHPAQDKYELDLAAELFSGIIPVKLVGPYFSWTPWDTI